MNGVISSLEHGHPCHLDLAPTMRASADVLSKCKEAISKHNVSTAEGAQKSACKTCCKTLLKMRRQQEHTHIHTGENVFAYLKHSKLFTEMVWNCLSALAKRQTSSLKLYSGMLLKSAVGWKWNPFGRKLMAWGLRLQVAQWLPQL